MLKPLPLIAAAAIALSASVAPAAAADAKCPYDKTIKFSGLDWDSDRFHVSVTKFIFEKGYGCTVEVIPGSTIPMLSALIRGQIDITMEMWKDNVTEAWEKGEKAGKVKLLGVNFPDAIQGWFVPKYLVEGENAPAKGLKSVQDLAKFKDLFADPEEPGKGRFYNCILGWGCEKVNTKKLEAYDLLKDYTNFRPGAGAALAAAIASAHKRKRPIVYYYWGPTWVMGKYDSVMLEEAPYDKEIWDKMDKEDHPKQVTAYPLVKVYTAANTKFIKAAPVLVEYLKKYHTSNKLVSAALVYLQENRGSRAKDAAVNFLKKRPDVWSKWVPADVAMRVKAALK